LNRPELTAERFIADPFAAEAGARMYKTGDLGRWLADGTIEFLGRNDLQVKIRGFRIELGEIEARLAEHPGVREAVVIAREDEPGDKRLVAYWVGVKGEEPGAEDLRNHLLKTLPQYMVPAAFVLLQELPLNRNGKIDRKALPAPDLHGQLQHQYVAPRTPTEEVLAQIWAEVLGLEQVGVHDNFFVLGGHSLLATQVMARVRESLAVEVPLRTLFEESVTVRELAEHIEQARRDEQGLQVPALVSRPRQGPLPLSLAQERLWFLEQLETLGSTYNETMALELDGELDVEVLERSFAELVRRHESLRTRIETTGEGQGIQVIDPAGEFRLEFKDLSTWPAEQRRAEAQRFVQAEAVRPFNLTQELFRVALLQLAPEEHILLVMLHHIASDVWSLLGVLQHELNVLYAAYKEGRPSPLPELEVQYADYALWQREWLQGEVLERQLSYWREQLSGMSAALELPTDRPRPATPSYKGARQPLVLSSELSASLVALGRREGVTLYMVLLAALQVVLSRWSGQDDIAVGSPIAGRTHRKMEGLIGFFLNTLVMRTDLSGDPTFLELLERVKKTALGAYTHQDLPFEKLVAELRPERDLSRQALFQVMLTLQNMPMSSLQLPGLAWKPVPPTVVTSKFDLSVEFFEGAAGLRGSVEYATDLFDDATIERLIVNFKTLLEGVVADADRAISELPLLSERERRQVLYEWNETAQEYAKEKCIQQLFEEQVEKSPEAVAVVFEDAALTYRELNRRANQLAHYLREMGVKPEERVGLCMERSLEMIVGLLGVLKAGGAYVPLDPGYPSERLQFMLEDSDTSFLITQKRIAGQLPEVALPRVYLDSDWSVLEQYSDAALAPNTQASNLAYVIYTSGSTGKPKAVAAVHSAVMNRIAAQREIAAISEEEVCCQKTSIGFVDAVAETWSPLMSGRPLIVASEAAAKDPEELLSLIRSEGITRLVTVPTLAWSLVQSPRAQWGLMSLRSWTLSGEALSADLLRELKQRLPECRFINLYGSSEVAADATCYAEADVERLTIPIGRPIANTQTYILDEHLEPVPVGVVGELYIGGEGLARGYLGQPGLTAERFIASPYGAEGSRLYRTGDRARYVADGNLEFMGRADEQVKIRGFRIELGEIEARLAEHPGVREAVVIAREDEPGDKRLVAYWVGVKGEEPGAEDLRNHLLKTLPQYMVPAAFVLLQELPLNRNGKIDRKALPAPDLHGQLQHQYVAPRTLVEEILCTTWGEVLRVERVGIHDNFFDLGGHSLAMVRVREKVQLKLDKSFPLIAMFEHSTIASLTEYLTDNNSETHSFEQINLRAREQRQRRQHQKDQRTFRLSSQQRL
jgi:amino acid adenylation domain-containing protein